MEEQVLKLALDSSTGRTNRGGDTFRGRERGRGTPGFNKSLVECFYCHDLGHF